ITPPGPLWCDGPGSWLRRIMSRSEREVLIVGLVRINPGLTLDDDALAWTLDDGHLLVTRYAQIHAVLDFLALQDEIGNLVHDVASILRIPEENLVNRTAFEIRTGILRQAETIHAGLFLQPGFLDSAADADHVNRGRSLETLDVRIFAENFLGLFIS